MHELQPRNNEPFPLTFASEGQQVKIVLLHGHKGLGMRLASMGLNIDSRIRVLQRMGNSLVIMRDEIRLALGTGIAQKILVIPV